MGIAPEFLPDGSPYLTYSLDHALNIVLLELATVCSTPGAWTVYEVATYNLAGQLLLETCPDQTYAVTGASWTGNLVTLTTAPSAITPGVSVAVNGISAAGATPTGYNGIFTVGGASSTQLVYALAPNPGIATTSAASTVSEQFFFKARQGFKLAAFFPGVVASAADNGTSAGIDNPDFMSGLTLNDLQLLKTPYGRTYLAIAQRWGPSVWGLT